MFANKGDDDGHNGSEDGGGEQSHHPGSDEIWVRGEYGRRRSQEAGARRKPDVAVSEG